MQRKPFRAMHAKERAADSLPPLARQLAPFLPSCEDILREHHVRTFRERVRRERSAGRSGESILRGPSERAPRESSERSSCKRFLQEHPVRASCERAPRRPAARRGPSTRELCEDLLRGEGPLRESSAKTRCEARALCERVPRRPIARTFCEDLLRKRSAKLCSKSASL